MSKDKVIDDTKDYVTRDDWFMRDDIENAPLGKRLLIINEGGKLIEEILTNRNRHLYQEWSELPKRAKHGKHKRMHTHRVSDQSSDEDGNVCRDS